MIVFLFRSWSAGRDVSFDEAVKEGESAGFAGGAGHPPGLRRNELLPRRLPVSQKSWDGWGPGEGQPFFRKVSPPFPQTPIPPLPKTFDVIESLFTTFPVD